MPYLPTRVPATAALLAGLTLSACTTTSSQAMLPTEVDVVASHPYRVAVVAEGTPRRFGIAPPLVSSEDLKAGIEEAVLQSGLFEGVTTRAHAGYVLRVRVHELDKPEAGLDMTTGAVLTWSLHEAGTDTKVWMETVETSSTATTIQSSELQDRLKTSIEGAVRKNIARGLHLLSKVELTAPRPTE